MTYGLGNRITELDNPEKQSKNKQQANLVAPMVALQSPDIACDFVMKIAGQGEVVIPVTRDLARVISAWPKLSPALQAAVLAIVDAAD